MRPQTARFQEVAILTTMGINISTSEIKCVILDGTVAQPEFVAFERVMVPERNPAETAVWMDTQLSLFLARHQPAKVGYRITLPQNSLKMVQVTGCGQAILNLLCGRAGIPIQHFVPNSLTPARLGMARGTDLHEVVDRVLGLHPPHWDARSKDCAVIAWSLLQEATR